MAWKKEYTTKNGKTVVLRDLNNKDSIKKTRNFINSFVVEKAYLLYDKKITYKEQKAWFLNQLKQIKNKAGYYIVIEHDKKMIGSVVANRQLYKLKDNILLGIAITPNFRGLGLGYFSLKALIDRVKKEMKPKNIYLSVYSKNYTAKKLYKKLGFKFHHRLKNWVNHYGKFMDEEFYIYKSK